MKETVVFRPRVAIRAFWAVFPLLVVGGILAMWAWLFGGWAWPGETEGGVIGLLGPFLLVMVIFVLAVAGYMAALWLSERIIFSDAFLERRGVPHLLLRKGRLAYPDIRQVRRAMRYVLLVEPNQGKPWIIAVKQYAGGVPGILEEIRRHVPADRVEPGLEETLLRRDRRDRAYVWCNGAATALMLGASLLIWNDALGGVFFAWRQAAGVPRSLRVEGYEIGGDGSVWVLAREVFADLDDLSDLGVLRIAPQADVSLSLPPAQDVFPEWTDVSPFFVELHVDRTGRPWIGSRYDDLLLVWSGDEWEPHRPPEGALEPAAGLAAFADGLLWYRSSEETRLISLDPNSGATEEHLLGGGEGRNMRILSGTDSLMAAAYRVGTNGALSHVVDYYANGAWSGCIPVEMPPAGEDLGWPEIYSVDQEGNLYLLLKQGEPCYDGALHGWLGRWDMGSAKWGWREVVIGERCRTYSDLMGIVVDPLGRVWVQSRRSVAVFPPAASDRAADESQPMRSYTEDNSGYQRGRLRLDAQGRVWAGGDYSNPVWIDASDGELPRPFPPWLTFFLGTPWGGYTLLYAGIILLLVNNRFLRRALSRKREG